MININVQSDEQIARGIHQVCILCNECKGCIQLASFMGYKKGLKAQDHWKSICIAVNLINDKYWDLEKQDQEGYDRVSAEVLEDFSEDDRHLIKYTINVTDQIHNFINKRTDKCQRCLIKQRREQIKEQEERNKKQLEEKERKKESSCNIF